MKRALLALCLATPAFAGGGVVVVKQAGVPAFQEALDELNERCRVPTKVVSIDAKRPLAADDISDEPRLLITIGQDALEAVKDRPEPLIAILAAYPSGNSPTLGIGGSPEQTFRVLRAALPRARRIAMLAGPRQAMTPKLVTAANRAGLELVILNVTDGPSAFRALRNLEHNIDGLWLAPDPDVVSAQVFRYALQLQLERRLPVIASTRNQVHSGALFAVDIAPRALGRAVADAVNALRTSSTGAPPIKDLLPTTITVNRIAAQRLGVDTGALAGLGARIE